MRLTRRRKPRELVLKITNKCNFRCAECPRQIYPARYNLGAEMPYGLACDYLDMAHDWDLSRVCITGMGEPTTHPDFEAIVAYAKQCQLSIEISTNGWRYGAPGRPGRPGRPVSGPYLGPGVYLGPGDWIHFSVDEMHRRGCPDLLGYKAHMEEVICNARWRSTLGQRFGVSIRAVPGLSAVLKPLCKYVDRVKIDPYIEMDTAGIFAARICPNPWTQMVIDPEGWLNPCCITGHKQLVEVTDLCEAWISAELDQWRYDLLTDQSGYCSRCPHYARTYMDWVKAWMRIKPIKSTRSGK